MNKKCFGMRNEIKKRREKRRKWDREGNKQSKRENKLSRSRA